MNKRRAPVASDRRFRKPADAADFGPAERWQHTGRVLEPTEKPGVLAARVTEEHPLDVLVLRRVITERHRAAGLRLRRDFQGAGLAFRGSLRYSPDRATFNPFADPTARSEAQEQAYVRWRRALRGLGSRYSDVVLTVACFDRLPAALPTPELRRGLEALTGYYEGTTRKPGPTPERPPDCPGVAAESPLREPPAQA